jgi:hypothetical protein
MGNITPEQIEQVRLTGLELVETLKQANPLGDYPGAVPATLPEPEKKLRKVKK